MEFRRDTHDRISKEETREVRFQRRTAASRRICAKKSTDAVSERSGLTVPVPSWNQGCFPRALSLSLSHFVTASALCMPRAAMLQSEARSCAVATVRLRCAQWGRCDPARSQWCAAHLSSRSARMAALLSECHKPQTTDLTASRHRLCHFAESRAIPAQCVQWYAVSGDALCVRPCEWGVQDMRLSTGAKRRRTRAAGESSWPAHVRRLAVSPKPHPHVCPRCSCSGVLAALRPPLFGMQPPRESFGRAAPGSHCRHHSNRAAGCAQQRQRPCPSHSLG